MGIAVGIFRGQAAVFQEGFHFFPGFLSGESGVSQAFADTVAQSAAGVKGLRRGLENHLHGSVDLPQRLAFQVGDVLAVQKDGAGGHVHQPGDHVDGGGFAAAAFPDDGEALAGEQVKADIFHGGKVRLPLPGEGFGQAADFQDRFHVFTSGAGARPQGVLWYSLPEDLPEHPRFFRIPRSFRPSVPARCRPWRR